MGSKCKSQSSNQQWEARQFEPLGTATPTMSLRVFHEGDFKLGNIRLLVHPFLLPDASLWYMDYALLKKINLLSIFEYCSCGVMEN